MHSHIPSDQVVIQTTVTGVKSPATDATKEKESDDDENIMQLLN